jgi:hypothetical protein
MSALHRISVTVFALGILVDCGVSFGQTGSLNPNPLQPSGVGSRAGSDIDISRGGGGPGMGRGVGPGTGYLDENPADTLLKDINGTNYGRRTGSNLFLDNRRRTSGYRGVTPKFEGGAVRFDRRGTYEEAIYGSRPGSYSLAYKARRRGK